MIGSPEQARLGALVLAGKEEAASLPPDFQRVIAAIRKFNDFGQLRLQTASDEMFVMVGLSFDMNREILKTLVVNNCTVSVLSASASRISVVIGRNVPQPVTLPLPLRPMPPVPSKPSPLEGPKVDTPSKPY